MSIVEQEKDREWSQILAILISTLGSLTIGVFFMWPTQSIPILLQQGVTIEAASYVVLIPSISLALSSPLIAYLLDKIGRKKSLMLVAIPQLIAWILIASSDNIYVIYLGRVFSGIGDSSSFSVIPAYIAEIATPRVRGTWGNGLTFLAYVGNFLASFVGYQFSISTTACIFLSVPIVMLIGIVFLPESPYYLIMKNEEDKAKQALRWLRRKQDVEVEYKQLVSDVNRQMSESGRVKDLFTIASNRKALITAAFLRGAQQCSGMSSIAIYASLIFTISGANFSANDSTNIFLSLLVVTNLIASIILDRIGRRRAMVISCLGSSILLTLEGIYFYLKETGSVDLSQIHLFPLIGLCTYTLLFAIGVGIMPTLMLGELFSSSVKGKCLCVTNIFFGIFFGSATKIFQVLYTNFGIYVCFWFFAGTSLINSVASLYFVPETQGKTLEEIQQNLKKNKR